MPTSSPAAQPNPVEESRVTTNTGTLRITQARIRWPVLIGSATMIIAISIWAIVAPERAGSFIGGAVSWVSETFGWYFVLLAGVVVAFALYLAFSANGRTKLGPDHSKPQFNMFTWASMLFAAGIGIDLMFFAVAEPIAQYVGPPSGEAKTIEAARQAIVWTLFHYGPVGWGMYAILGAAFAYFAYRRNLPLNIRSLLSPIFGRRVEGWTGHTFDILSILGTIFGISVTLGIGVVQLAYGMHILFGTPDNVGMQIALIVLSVVMATISTVSGVDKGIRRLSELNVILAIVLLVWIVITGETRRLFDGMVMNIGDFVSRFPSMVMDTYAWDRPDAWMQGWTLFFWAWWVAWAPFVGLFLARISRGRTIRQFVTGVLIIPFAFIAVFISILGNSALELVIGGDKGFADVAVTAPEQAFFSLMQQYPLAPAVVALALVTGLLFYVTSADSGAFVLATLSSQIEDPRQDASKGLRIFWSFTTGLLTLAMLLVGGVSTLQQATVVLGLPVSVLIFLVMISLFRALRTETQHQEGYAMTMPLRLGHSETSWRRRLRRSTTYPTDREVATYVDAIVKPALAEVVSELRSSGVKCALEITESPVAGLDSLLLTARFDQQKAFTYQVYPVSHERPKYALGDHDPGSYYYRLEVFTASGSHGYDVWGYSSERIIGDVLGHFESHVEYLRIAEAGTGASNDVHDPVITDWQDDFGRPEELESVVASPVGIETPRDQQDHPDPPQLSNLADQVDPQHLTKERTE